MTPTTPSKLKHSHLTHHRTVGLGYLAISVAAVILGSILSLLMRLHLTYPTLRLPFHGLILPEQYLALVTMHGTLMLFFVLTVAPQSGFGNLILPAQIGSRRMAFPRLNFASMILTAIALGSLIAAFFVPQGAPLSGWTAYPPLSASPLAGPGQATGMDLWLASIAMFAIASTASSINTLTTIVKLRCDGMSWSRLPLTVWGWLTASLLSILAFSVLLAALTMLFADRHLHTGFFLPAQDLISTVLVQHRGDGSPLLWLHLFWFFGHPEVYIAILPGMGLTSMVLANFARRPVFAYRLMIATTLLIGFLGILVWGHHMFVAGLNPFAGSAFAISTMAIALPASAKVLSWLATIWGSRSPTTTRATSDSSPHKPVISTETQRSGETCSSKPTSRFPTPMLFALGFVSLFIVGGLSGPILAQPILDEYLHNTFFVVAHFHLIMAMAGVFGLFCATYYWYPLLFNKQLNEPLGKLHFWLTIIGAYSTFLPMHLTGLAGEPRHYAQLTGPSIPTNHLLQATIPLQLHITFSAFFLATAQILFLANLIRTSRSKTLSPQNPWGATTMEWAPQALNISDTTRIATYSPPCRYSDNGLHFYPQWEPANEIAPTSPTPPEVI